MSDESADIIVISDDIRGATGFGTNARLVCWALSENWDVVNVCPQAGSKTSTTVRGREIDIYPSETRSRTVNDYDFARENLQETIDVLEPDVVVSLVDLAMVDYLRELKKPVEASVQLRRPGQDVDVDGVVEGFRETLESQNLDREFIWIAQFPVDGTQPPESWKTVLADIDRPIAMSEFGQGVVEMSLGMDIPSIPHAVEADEVYDGETGDFIVGSVNTNQWRKRHPRMLEAWAMFYESVGRPDDVKFYLHADRQADVGWNLTRFLREYNLQDAMMPYQGKVSKEMLNRLYAQFDVFTSATAGEGFGLTAVEAMYQKTPAVITDYTTTHELVEKGEPSPRGHPIDIETTYMAHPKFGNTRRALVNVEEMADALIDYYRNRKKLERHSENAHQWVDENLDWNDLAHQWQAMMAQTMAAIHG